IKEIESSVIGYRAQQLRPLAVHECPPMIMELAKLHSEMYDELLAFLRPGVTIGQVVEKTRELGSQVAPSTGPLAGSYARLTLHGRGLGDDHPLVLDSGRPGQSEIYEGTKRAWDAQLPENGVYICKP